MKTLALQRQHYDNEKLRDRLKQDSVSLSSAEDSGKISEWEAPEDSSPPRQFARAESCLLQLFPNFPVLRGLESSGEGSTNAWQFVLGNVSSWCDSSCPSSRAGSCAHAPETASWSRVKETPLLPNTGTQAQVFDGRFAVEVQTKRQVAIEGAPPPLLQAPPPS